MYKVKVYVTLRESVLDPQGTAVKNRLRRSELRRNSGCPNREIYGTYD